VTIGLRHHCQRKRDTMRKQNDWSSAITFRKACDFYMQTHKFGSLSGASQIKYETMFRSACETPVHNGKHLGRIKLKDLRFKHFDRAYETWLRDRGPSSAQYISSCISIVLNTAIRNEVTISNYMALVSKQTVGSRRVKWTADQVKLFLDVAYSEWKWRSIGLIVHMSYEWGQRIGDMRKLKWECLDLDAQRLDLTQSKRGVAVHLPIGDNLVAMLKQQKIDMGFQEYVAPRVKPSAGAYSHYRMDEIGGLTNAVKKEAGLPNELQARDMRRTAITEMVEAGVDLAGIMQVSGHQNPNSVQPYMVNTFSGATTALNKRWNKG